MAEEKNNWSTISPILKAKREYDTLMADIKALKALNQSLQQKGWLVMHLKEDFYVEIAHPQTAIDDVLVLSKECYHQVHNILQKEVSQSISEKIIQKQKLLEQNIKSLPQQVEKAP